MDDDIFENIKSGLDDAVAFARGDETRGDLTTIAQRPNAVRQALENAEV